ncbi:MAG: Rab family GTPase [Promethearchaeota archaeon]
MSSNWIFKCIVAGAGGVGKTALIERYVSGKFIEDHKMTIGAQFSVKDVGLSSGEHVRLQLWDFAGEERFRFLLGDYCRGASGAFICYDLTDYSTFEQIPEWLRIIRQNAGMVPIILVGNKYDLPNHEVDVETAEQYAEDARCLMNVMCSSKLDLNVNPMFEAMSKWLIYYAEQMD